MALGHERATRAGGRGLGAAWVLAGCSLAPASAFAQPVAWTQRVVSGPSGRGDVALAYDSARQRTVLFGGTTDGFTGSGETWEWDGTSWSQPQVAGPSPRLLDALAYDSARGVTVLFGGINGNTINGETWEWDGTAWVQRQVAGPSPRWAHTMAFDASRGVTVLFGGYTGPGGGHNGETWEWNGTAWTQRALGGGATPPPRFGSGMAYDSARHVTVLFGGSNAGSPNLSDTWEWNGTGGGAWTQRVVSGPSARYFHAMAYDAARGVTVLFGGTNSSGVPTSETWEWNGGGAGAWTQRVISAPSAREDHALAYDSARGKTVLFGGYSAGWNGETWELGSSCTAPSIATQPASATVCAGAGSAPFSVVAAGSEPLFYQWQLEVSPGVWSGMGNDPFPLPCGGGAFASAGPIDSPSVTIGIHPCAGVTHYQVRCVVSNACGTATSDAAAYIICAADADCDGQIEPADVASFVNTWFAGVQTGGPGGDFDGNGRVEPADIAAFVNAWFSALQNGC